MIANVGPLVCQFERPRGSPSVFVPFFISQKLLQFVSIFYTTQEAIARSFEKMFFQEKRGIILEDILGSFPFSKKDLFKSLKNPLLFTGRSDTLHFMSQMK